MAGKYGIWLSWNNQQEGFELPVLPSEIGSSVSGDSSGTDVFGLGKINIIKDRQLAEYNIESIFPARKYPFVNAAVLLEPKAYIDYLIKWMETKKPIRFVYVGETVEVNTAASIDSFEWKEVAGSPGDIQFLLRLKEYKFYAARRVVTVPSGQATSSTPNTIAKAPAKREDTRVPTKTYTLKNGDSLWTIAQKQLGNGSRWKEIQSLNQITDADLKRLPVGKVLKLP